MEKERKEREGEVDPPRYFRRPHGKQDRAFCDLEVARTWGLSSIELKEDWAPSTNAEKLGTWLFASAARVVPIHEIGWKVSDKYDRKYPFERRAAKDDIDRSFWTVSHWLRFKIDYHVNRPTTRVLKEWLNVTVLLKRRRVMMVLKEWGL